MARNTPAAGDQVAADQAAGDQVDVDQLRAELAAAWAEVDRLVEHAEQLTRERDEARELAAGAGAGAVTTRPQPRPPSYGISEGTRAELELLNDRAAAGDKVKVEVRDPFTGRQLDGSGQAVRRADVIRDDEGAARP